MLTTRFISAAALIAFVAPFTASASGEAPQGQDRAYQLFGTWSCKYGGLEGTLAFTRNPDGSIAMKNIYETYAGPAVHWDEIYRFNAEHNLWAWSASIVSPPNYHYQRVGTASPWSGDKWIFTGTERVGSSAQDIRMIYTSPDASTLQRQEDQRSDDGSWQSVGAVICKRTTPG